MLVINYIHKAQGLDKALPLVFTMKQQEPQVNVTTVLDLEETAVQGIPPDILDALHELSDEVIRVENNRLFAFLQRVHKIFPVWALIPIARLFLSQMAPAWASGARSQPVLMLCINTANDRLIGRIIQHHVKSGRGFVAAYLKSLNDQGRGLTVVGKAKPNTGQGFHDVLLVPTRSILQKLRDSGYPDQELLMSGYPPFFRQWRAHVVDQARQANVGGHSRPLFVVFARGPVSHKKDGDQIISAAMERRLLSDIVETVFERWPGATIWIKPHPYQDAAFIHSLSESRPRVSVTSLSVHRLSALADIAISTFSSSSLDALAYGKPSIEYFVESASFRAAHEGGSPFGAFGVAICRTKDDLRQSLADALPEASKPQVLPSGALADIANEENVSELLRLVRERSGD